MKKQIITAICIFLFGIILVTAQAVLSNDRNISLTKEQKTSLENINLEDYNTYDNELDGKYQRCLKKVVCVDKVVEIYEEGNGYVEVTYQDCHSAINTCSGFMEEKDLDNWEDERIKNIANANIKRNDNIVKVREGVTTIK